MEYAKITDYSREDLAEIIIKEQQENARLCEALRETIKTARLLLVYCCESDKKLIYHEKLDRLERVIAKED